MKTATKGTKVRKVGELQFDQLEEELQMDVLASLAYVLAPWRRHSNPNIQMTDYQEEVLTLLSNGPAILPLVEVSPEAIFDPNRGVSRNVVENYAEAMKDGDDFPPVVIDSSKAPILALLEGGHRTAAAVEARRDKILAIDLAGAQEIEMKGRWKGLQTYDFKYARRK